MSSKFRKKYIFARNIKNKFNLLIKKLISMFKKHPKGLIGAALANMGERFGFYIMMAILTLFISAKFGLSEITTGYI